MAKAQSLETHSQRDLDVPHKKELDTREEKTLPGKFYMPSTDIYGTDQALVVVMDMPGVEKKDVDIKLEKNVLSVEGRIDFSKYDDLKPVYTEYNVGHFTRSFRLSSEIDGAGISATINDGVLTLTLPKAKVATPRRIEIG
jgi:HSP20 family protein